MAGSPTIDPSSLAGLSACAPGRLRLAPGRLCLALARLRRALDRLRLALDRLRLALDRLRFALARLLQRRGRGDRLVQSERPEYLLIEHRGVTLRDRAVRDVLAALLVVEPPAEELGDRPCGREVVPLGPVAEERIRDVQPDAV